MHSVKEVALLRIAWHTLVQSIEVIPKLVNPCADPLHLVLSILLIAGEPLVQPIEVFN